MIKVISKAHQTVSCTKAQMTTLTTQSGMKTSATQAVTQLAIRLTSGDKDPIRGMKAPDGRTVFSVYDAMWNTGAYATRDAVTSAWTTLLLTDFGEDVRASATYLKFPGRGQRDTPCMDIRGLQRLIICLGGKIGAEYRALAETTLTRLVAGDESMIAEIEENAASDAPIQILAREALASEAHGHTHMMGDGPGPEDDAMDGDEAERMALVRGIASGVAALGQQSSAVAAELKTIVPVIRYLTDELIVTRTDRDKERHMRHQADGRYGSEVREANKHVRDAAAACDRALRKEEVRVERMEGLLTEQRGWMRDMEQRYDEERRADRTRLAEMHVAHLRLAECLIAHLGARPA